MSDDAIAAGIVDAARRAVEQSQEEPPEGDHRSETRPPPALMASGRGSPLGKCSARGCRWPAGLLA